VTHLTRKSPGGNGKASVQAFGLNARSEPKANEESYRVRIRLAAGNTLI
jgi:hypothetical protein